MMNPSVAFPASVKQNSDIWPCTTMYNITIGSGSHTVKGAGDIGAKKR